MVIFSTKLRTIYIYVFICGAHRLKAKSSKIRQKGVFYELQRVVKLDNSFADSKDFN